MAQRMPGIKVAAPMTPEEYQHIYECFMNDDEPYYVSEHRKSYDNTEELENIILPNADFTIFPISITRLEMKKLSELAKQENIQLNIIHQLWIKPFIVEDNWKIALDNSKFGGLVTDDDYVEGTASSIANELSLASGKRVWTLGLEPRTAGFHPSVDNLPPSAEQIIKKLKQIKYGI
jgi:pyruvate/2-oxoglutarate/acetoin dehydrogenase E1 component